MPYKQCKVGPYRTITKGTLLKTEVAFCPYLAFHWTDHVALPFHDPQPRHLWPKQGSKENHFTLEAETVIRPYLTSHCSEVALPNHTQVWSKSGSNEPHFAYEEESFSSIPLFALQRGYSNNTSGNRSTYTTVTGS
jgi:hypothetical protein